MAVTRNRDKSRDGDAHRGGIERDARIAVVGRRAVLEALAAPEASVELVRLARGAPSSLRGEIQRACREHAVDCQIGSVARVREIANEPRHDQGVAARVTLHGVEEVGTAARDVAPRAHWLALDGLTNPSNVGMITRSAAASGIAGILWPRTGTPWLNALIVKASAGAALRCRIARCDALADGLEQLAGVGFRILGLDVRDGDDLFVSPVPARAVYVIGSETEGLSRPVAERLDGRVRIPISDRVESLNAAVSASLVCFHVSNPRR